MIFKHNFDEQIQDENLDFDELIHRWSKICENSVDRALKEHHIIDPLNQHHKGLPQKYRGKMLSQTTGKETNAKSCYVCK